MSGSVSRALVIADDHPAFDGHFPGQPLLPGVALLAEVLEAARADPALAACVGPAPRLDVAKFLAPVRPGTAWSIDFRIGPKALAWTVRAGEQVAASGQFGRADLAAPVAALVAAP
jgi:3-hydroxymyristoyl/3-hydroxydecanoyl-(acyl carrier protein) dehydratase